MSDEQSYSNLIGRIRVGSDRMRISDIRSLSREELTQINDASQKIGDFVANCNLFEICATNHKELIVYYDKVRVEYNITHNIEDSIGTDILIEINRLLMNYLSSFRTMIDHYQTRYTRIDRQGTDQLKSFKSFRSAIYNSSFHYRFFYQLRNYVQHCSLPPCGMNAGFHRDDQGNPVAALSVYFDRDKLLSTFDGWKKIRRDLQSEPSQMEISHYLAPFHREIEKLFSDCTKMELEMVSEAHCFLSDLVAEVEAQMPGATPLIADLSKVSDSGGNLPARYLPMDQLAQIQRTLDTQT